MSRSIGPRGIGKCWRAIGRRWQRELRARKQRILRKDERRFSLEESVNLIVEEAVLRRLQRGHIDDAYIQSALDAGVIQEVPAV